MLRYHLQISKHNHLTCIQQALKVFNFKHVYYKYKLGFRKQLEYYSLSKDVFQFIIKNEKNLVKSSSYASSMQQVSNFLSINSDECGLKSKLSAQYENLNTKFNKKTEMVEIGKFCLENYYLIEHRENVKIITS
jgi:hypothetical protein